eukprot:scaffold55464_cov25-Tisochrysis_lutea.AAC.2
MPPHGPAAHTPAPHSRWWMVLLYSVFMTCVAAVEAGQRPAHRGMRRLGSVPVAQQSLGLHEKKGWAGWACKNSWAGSVKSVALRGCLGLNCHIVIFVMTGLEVEANNPAAP